MGLFRSFWQAGFESACQVNSRGCRLDMMAATQHDARADEDYALLRAAGFLTARDGLRWHLIERRGGFDFSSVRPLAEAARRNGVQVIWNLCHYGWPDDLDLFAPAFVDRFARYCRAVARFFADLSDEVPLYAPINEISFICYAIDKGVMFPYVAGRSCEVKRQLVRAVLAGIEAIWEVDRQARIIHVDPLIHIVPPRGRPDLAEASAGRRLAQFEAWDMLAGRCCPELGGRPDYLDVVGLNFYHANQWELSENRLRWEDEPRDERWVPLHRLLAEVRQRYERPLFLAETSHFGAGRGRWIREIADEACRALACGVPLEGVCIYPILDRPDWENPGHWHNSGLWDLLPDGRGQLRRVLHREYAGEVRRAQRRVEDLLAGRFLSSTA